MYRPRRTTEFHEDAREETATKRQTRSLLRGTATPIKKPGSNITPLRTRAVSSVERPVVLHTDKKWVQEQSEQIAEYLNEMVQTRVLKGFPNEFFSRGGAALRQITIKQLVAIVNFFLQHIWRNRVSVGTNHVEDITNVLQKLKYSYPVNKSWLMTPTTTHSFGHVIVMLDFLKDFAVPPVADDEGQHDFPFTETNEQLHFLATTLDQSKLSSTHDSTVILNETINNLLFVNAAESFAVWDKQEWDEYASLQRKVGNRIIKHLCDLPNTEALSAELARQQSEIQELEEQLQSLDKGKSEKLKQLKPQEQQLEEQLLSTKTNLEQQRKQLEDLHKHRAQNTKKLKLKAEQLKQLQRQTDSQKHLAEQYQRTKLLLTDLKNEEQVYKGQLRNLVEHSDNQQVQLARAKKHLLNQVEDYNKHAQNITLDPDILGAIGSRQLELMLPLPLQDSDLEARMCTLKQLATFLHKCGIKHAERQKQLERHIAEQEKRNKSLEAELVAIDAQIQSNKQQLARWSQSNKLKCSKWAQHQQQLVERKIQLSSELEQLQGQRMELELLLQAKRQESEDVLSNAERLQQERLKNRISMLNNYQSAQSEMEARLDDIHRNLAGNEAKLNKLRSELAEHKLSSFEDELEADFKKVKV